MSPPLWVLCPLPGKGTLLTWKPGAPAGPCSPLSPAGPWGTQDRHGGGQVAPEPLFWWPGVTLGGRGPGDTYGGAGGTLGTGFTILASGTLEGGGGRGGGSEQPPQGSVSPPGWAWAWTRPRDPSKAGRHRGELPAATSPAVPAPARPGAPGTGSQTPHPAVAPGREPSLAVIGSLTAQSHRIQPAFAP